MTLDQAFDLAAQHYQTGRFGESESLCRQILAQQPSYSDAMQLLGVLAQRAGNSQAAEELLRKAAAINPRVAAYHANLALVLDSMGRLPEALVACRQAIALRPDSAAFHNSLGHILKRMGKIGEAIDACRQALALRPAFPEALNNLADAYRRQGAWPQAVATFGQSLAIAPAQPEARFHLALLLLLLGDFAQGLPLLESRWEMLPPAQRPQFAQPMWDGSSLQGRRILLHAEQGFGDTIQFIRYAPLVRAKGGQVIVQCQPELRRLLAYQNLADQLVVQGDPLPAFDLHCPLLSLPLVMRTTPTTIPAGVPYLNAEPDRARAWRERLETLGAGKRVGLVWSGSAENQATRHRSMPLSALTPLATVGGIQFISLQKKPILFDAPAPAGMQLIDWTDELHDFADTAALIDALHVVIAIDTAAAHLAGAMGKPTWMLLSFESDWRWFLDRTDTPWYPTMRLFRQPRPGDWETPLRQIAEELKKGSGVV